MINLPIIFFKDMMGMAIILKNNLDLFKNNMEILYRFQVANKLLLYYSQHLRYTDGHL